LGAPYLFTKKKKINKKKTIGLSRYSYTTMSIFGKQVTEKKWACGCDSSEKLASIFSMLPRKDIPWKM